MHDNNNGEANGDQGRSQAPSNTGMTWGVAINFFADSVATVALFCTIYHYSTKG
jgi:hypothetical protein